MPGRARGALVRRQRHSLLHALTDRNDLRSLGRVVAPLGQTITVVVTRGSPLDGRLTEFGRTPEPCDHGDGNQAADDCKNDEEMHQLRD